MEMEVLFKFSTWIKNLNLKIQNSMTLLFSGDGFQLVNQPLLLLLQFILLISENLMNKPLKFLIELDNQRAKDVKLLDLAWIHKKNGVLFQEFQLLTKEKLFWDIFNYS